MFLVLRDGVLDVRVDLLLKIYEEKMAKFFLLRRSKA